MNYIFNTRYSNDIPRDNMCSGLKKDKKSDPKIQKGFKGWKRKSVVKANILNRLLKRQMLLLKIKARGMSLLTIFIIKHYFGGITTTISFICR